MSIADNFRRNVRSTRAKKRLTQEELAQKAGISVSYVSMLERGKRAPPLDTLESIGKALGVDPVSLLEGGRR